MKTSERGLQTAMISLAAFGFATLGQAIAAPAPSPASAIVKPVAAAAQAPAKPPLLTPLAGGGAIMTGMPMQLPSFLPGCGPANPRMNPGSMDVGMMVYTCTKARAQVRVDMDRNAALDVEAYIANNIQGMQKEGMKDPVVRFARAYSTLNGAPRNLRSIVVTSKDGKATFGLFIEDRKDSKYIVQITVPGGETAFVDLLATDLYKLTRFDAPAGTPVGLAPTITDAMASLRNELEAFEIIQSSYAWRLQSVTAGSEPKPEMDVASAILREGLGVEGRSVSLSRQVAGLDSAFAQWQTASPKLWKQAQALAAPALAADADTGAAYARFVPNVNAGMPDAQTIALYLVMKARVATYEARQPGFKAKRDALVMAASPKAAVPEASPPAAAPPAASATSATTTPAPTASLPK